MNNVKEYCRVEGHQQVAIENLLAKKRWTDEEFKLLTGCLAYTPYEREQALGAVPIENLLAALGISFPTQKSTPQICCFLPGHADNTASMTLYRRTNSCYCFGCQRRLNTIDVLVQLYGKSYSEALDCLLGDYLQLPAQLLRRRIKARFEELARRRQPQPKSPVLQLIKPALVEEVRLPVLDQVASFGKVAKPPQETDPSLEIAERQAEVTQILETAVNFYHFQLEHFPQAYQYLKGRGLTEATIEKHKLGYSSGVGLPGWLKRHHLDLELATKIGLLGAGGVEKLAGRVILPFFDQEDKVAMLTGRYLCSQAESYQWFDLDIPEPEDEEGATNFDAGGERIPPKYLHLRLPKPHLSRFLPATTARDYLLLVEGPFDYLLATQWGYPAVCTLGTNLGSENIQFLKERLTSGQLGLLLTCFDNDPERLLPDGTRIAGAGPQATARLLQILDSSKAETVRLPSNVKDIACLGELPDGEALLAQAVRQVYSCSQR